MRLFLASNDLGDFPEKLYALVGMNRKTLVISNARDHHSEADRRAIVDEDLGIITNCGLLPTELDLRSYLDKPNELKNYIDSFQPGCIFAMGGNIYSLATALNLSGMAEIIKNDLAKDKYAYAGYSAGSMNASEDLIYYHDSYGKRTGDRIEEAKSIYGTVITKGLNLIKEYICPHADEDKFSDVCHSAEKSLLQHGLTPIVLNNSDVVIVDNNELKIYKK